MRFHIIIVIDVIKKLYQIQGRKFRTGGRCLLDSL
jgi:hypothetical protein